MKVKIKTCGGYTDLGFKAGQVHTVQTVSEDGEMFYIAAPQPKAPYGTLGPEGKGWAFCDHEVDVM